MIGGLDIPFSNQALSNIMLKSPLSLGHNGLLLLSFLCSLERMRAYQTLKTGPSLNSKDFSYYPPPPLRTRACGAHAKVFKFIFGLILLTSSKFTSHFESHACHSNPLISKINFEIRQTVLVGCLPRNETNFKITIHGESLGGESFCLIWEEVGQMTIGNYMIFDDNNSGGGENRGF